MSNNESHWRWLWHVRCLQRIRVFLWLAYKGKLLTNDERVRWHMASDSRCEFCGEVETVSHVLRVCLVALAIWVRLVKRDELDEFLSMELQQWFVLNLSDASHFSNEVTDWDTRAGTRLTLMGRISWTLDELLRVGGELMANAVAQTVSRMRILNWGHLNMLEDCILSGHRQLKFAHCSMMMQWEELVQD
ncbi:hypothetical protein Gogos_015334 [Gossypium gossypioides]|uniref:Reverse transcriptase zinc-binding domain-containing protein n=1 Tax=Gossypium gossypioides TaxID=34282 RepID=A0A7J9C1B2_GOSGO|nr:hypothetical protein [Gossypium gossypioides]